MVNYIIVSLAFVVAFIVTFIAASASPPGEAYPSPDQNIIEIGSVKDVEIYTYLYHGQRCFIAVNNSSLDLECL